ncbi:N-acetylmuramoyl-L-alanine amidase [Fusobacterium necrophorum subsp. funduliforme]
MKTVLIIGHNARDKGAYSPYLKMSEYDYWNEVIKGLDVPVLRRNANRGYGLEMREMLSRLEQLNYDVAIELHFNSAISNAEGAEVLVYKGNITSKTLATKFLKQLEERGHKNRGIIGVSHERERNGAYGICNSRGNYILIEPFFGSNEKDCISVNAMRGILKNFIKEVEI